MNRKKRTSHARKYWVAGFLCVLLAALCLFFLPLLLSSAATSATIRIPREATPRNISDTLTKYFGADYASKVMRLIPDNPEKLAGRFGAYEVAEGTSPAMAARTLTHGAQTPLRLTINGVRDFNSFLPRIAARFSFPTDSLRALLNSPEFLRKHNLSRPEEAQALFLNDSYDFYWTATPEQVAEKIIDNYESFWTEERTAKARRMGVSPLQLTIIASIVDEETNAAEEKGTVGRLYINRLNKGMRLQADPTVRFALKDFTIKRVTGKHLGVDSPYNTYRVSGLPPGPIRTTSAATLQAILDSEPSDYLYMCAREDFSGRHNFAATYEQHQRNARRYQAALDSIGIK